MIELMVRIRFQIRALCTKKKQDREGSAAIKIFCFFDIEISLLLH